MSRLRLPAVLAALLAVSQPATADLSDGVDPTILAPGLVQASKAVDRLAQLVDEAEAIGTALFRVHNRFGENRAAAGAGEGKDGPSCESPWVIDLGARARELGRAFRDAVQSARMQARRVEDLILEPTVRPLLDASTNHRVVTLLARVDGLTRRYPEASTWHERYVEALARSCALALAPAPGIPDPAPRALDGDVETAAPAKRSLVAVLAVGGGWLCPGAVPAAGVMLVAGAVCYSASETCACEPVEVSPATVLGPETSAGSAN